MDPVKTKPQEGYPQVIQLLPLHPLLPGATPPERLAALSFAYGSAPLGSPKTLSATTLSFLPVTNFPFGLTFPTVSSAVI